MLPQVQAMTYLRCERSYKAATLDCEHLFTSSVRKSLLAFIKHAIHRKSRCEG